jgi:hypothetical protein
VGRANRNWPAVIVDGIAAGAAAAIPSGLPSTLYALFTERDPLEATRAAGTIVLPDDSGSSTLALAAIPVHLGMSIAWATVLAAVLPPRRTALYGAAAGVAIGIIDLRLADRWWPRIAALPRCPQLADHAMFGAIVGYVLSRKRKDRE